MILLRLQGVKYLLNHSDNILAFHCPMPNVKYFDICLTVNSFCLGFFFFTFVVFNWSVLKLFSNSFFCFFLPVEHCLTLHVVGYCCLLFILKLMLYNGSLTPNAEVSRVISAYTARMLCISDALRLHL